MFRFFSNFFTNNPLTQFFPFDFKFKLVASRILRTGPLPKHVAFIMDGNRRFAQNNGLALHQGHEAGSVSLVNIIDVCELLEITTVSIYAFSIENFNRSQDEVNLLFSLLVEKLQIFLGETERYNKYVKIKIVGNKSMVPEDILKRLQKVEDLTSQNDRLTLNVCFSYTSRDEIAHSIQEITSKVQSNQLLANQIDEKLIESHFYFESDTPPVDILIRTSGHTRLSDFLLWQVNENSEIDFINYYWPDFTYLKLYQILVKWGFEKFVSTKVNDFTNFVLTNTANTRNDKVDLKSLPHPPPLVSILGR